MFATPGAGMLLSSRCARLFLLLALVAGAVLTGCRSASTSDGQTGMTKAVPGWKIRENWRRLRQGMSEDEVTAVLGRPDRKEFGRWRTYWRYGTKSGGPQGMFAVDTKKVDTWEGPKD